MADISSGVLLVEIDGEICEFEGSFTVQPNSEQREAKISHAGKVGIKRTPIAPGFKATIQMYENVTAEWYDALVGKNATVRTRGRSYSFTGVTSVGMLETDLVEGTADIEVFAQTCTETVD